MLGNVIGGGGYAPNMAQPLPMSVLLGQPAAPINTMTYGAGSPSVIGGSTEAPLYAQPVVTAPPAAPIVQTVDPLLMAQYQMSLLAAQQPMVTAPTTPQPLAMPSTTAGGQVVYGVVDPAATQATSLPGVGTPTGGTAAAPGAQPAETPKPAPKTVTVKSGDTLSEIAAANGIKWQELYELNKGVIGGDPNLIRPGQELKLP